MPVSAISKAAGMRANESRMTGRQCTYPCVSQSPSKQPPPPLPKHATAATRLHINSCARGHICTLCWICAQERSAAQRINKTPSLQTGPPAREFRSTRGLINIAGFLTISEEAEEQGQHLIGAQINNQWEKLTGMFSTVRVGACVPTNHTRNSSDAV